MSRGRRPAAIEMPQETFVSFAQSLPVYAEYKATVGSASAQGIALGVFDRELRRRDQDGFWTYSTNDVAEGPLNVGDREIRLRDAAAEGLFKSQVVGPFALDLLKIRERDTYIGELLSRARSGRLQAELNDNAEDEKKYYAGHSSAAKAPVAQAASASWSSMNMQEKIKAWPPTRPAAAGASASAPANDDATIRAKAKAWLTFTRTPETSHAIVDQYVRADGTWPLGSDPSILRAIWGRLVGDDAPPYRLPLQAKPYGSNFAGMHLLKGIMRRMAAEPLPSRGDPRWTNWALYLFGAAMAAQPFTDGNKRACRTAYAIIMVTAGIDFVAPTDAYGSRLAAML